jgi:hypothetical protein
MDVLAAHYKLHLYDTNSLNRRASAGHETKVPGLAPAQ